MVQCCRCNGSGLCKNCSCVKAGKACIDCLPSKKQHCSNSCRQQSVTSPPQPSSPTVHSQLNSQRGDVFPQPSSRPSSQSLGQPGASSTSTLDGLRRDLSNSGPLLMSTKSNKLPDYQPVCKSSFVWGNIDSASFAHSLDSAYKEAVHWKSNLFKIPQGNAGKSFTAELSRLFYAFATCSALEPIALKAATILPLLLLQKTHRSSKTKDHINSLVKRLELWKLGDLTNLLREGRAIQDRLPNIHHRQNEQQLSRSFANLMFQGKTQAALRLLSRFGSSQ